MVGGEEDDLVNCNVGICKNSKKSVCRCEDSRTRIGQHNEPWPAIGHNPCTCIPTFSSFYGKEGRRSILGG